MIELIDTHTHIYDTNDFGGEEQDIINRMEEAGVTHAFLPNIDTKSIKDVLAFEALAPERLHPMMGLHPENVNAEWRKELDDILTELNRHKYYGIGEVGIDLYWDQTYKQEQIEVFTEQIKAAIDRDLPIIIHCRNGLKETLNCLKKFDKNKIRGIFHSFTGTIEETEAIKDCGNFKFGINGIVTFKKSTELQNTIKELDIHEIVLETDSPYLTPVPFRGKRNESSYVKYVAEKIAEIKDKKLEEIAEITSKSAKDLFFT